jgi:hypothetical protein
VKEDEVKSVNDFAQFVHDRVKEIAPGREREADPQALALTSGMLALDMAGEHAESEGPELVQHITFLRKRYDEGCKMWEGFIKHIRSLRMTSGAEIFEMEKQIKSLTQYTGKVEELTAALNKLSATLANPILKGVIK